MARNLISCDHAAAYADEEYIDMEISSSTLYCYSMNMITNSPPHQQSNRPDFEFQMCCSSSSGPLDHIDTTTSPADELFYKGKLLPLHLPPRLQMVQKLLHNNSSSTTSEDDHTFTPFTSFSTPLDHSCNISPSDSCRVSRELCPADYFFDCSTTTHHDDVLLTNNNNNNNNNSITSSTCSSGSTKSWSKKLKLIKQSSSIGSKLKASRAYLRSLFGKSSSGCADEGTTSAVSKAKECLNKYTKGAAAAKKKKNPFGQIYRESICRHQIEDCEREKMSEDIGGGGGEVHRRSFSGAIIKRCSATNKSPFSTSSSSNSSGSSSFSLSNANSSSSSGFHDLHLLKRSSSDSSEIESSIQGAIAHCKKSQQLFNKGRKTLSSEVGICSLSASMVAACEDQERPPLCRG